MKVLLWVGLGIILIIGVAVFGFFALFSSTTTQLRPLVDEFLVDCRDGNYAKAYARTSEVFRGATSEDELRAYMTQREAILGKYQRIKNVKGFNRDAGTGRKSTGSITVDIEFEKGAAEGKFVFQEEGDVWRLNNATITIPSVGPESANGDGG